jgi:hypothetical protein
MEQEKRAKIESYRLKAELFLEKNIKAFVKDINNSYYFCDILTIGELYLFVFDFKRQEKFRIFWGDIMVFDEYKKRGEDDNLEM